MSQMKQKYQDNYLDFGFTYLIEDDLQIPQCVVCMKTFLNSTMKPALTFSAGLLTTVRIAFCQFLRASHSSAHSCF